VSRVLNGHPRVSEQARQRVRAAITELNYRPSWAARALVTGRSDVVGVVTTRCTTFGTSAMLSALEHAAASADLGVHLTSVGQPDAPAVRAAADRLLGHGVGALVVLAPISGAAEALCDLDPTIPVVALGGDGEVDLPVVQTDQVAGARGATRHLLEAGHRTVWHVAGPSGWLDNAERAAGWRLALRDAGVPRPPLVRAAGWDAAAGYDAARELCRHLPDVTAVFAGNDHLALGVLLALHEQGLAVPGDVAVVGFDDVPESAYFFPPLTTVRPDVDALARSALALISADAPRRSGGRRLISPRLVVRASSRPAG
jgi:DNA-binding LacI/PurR family transcriptional regulator